MGCGNAGAMHSKHKGSKRVPRSAHCYLQIGMNNPGIIQRL